MAANRIFYYSGSGNSLWVAREMARMLTDTEIVSIATEENPSGKESAQRTGIVFPVYCWGVPPVVLHFIKKIAGMDNGYIFAIATNGGQVANTLVQLKKECAPHGLHISSGFSIELPSSYIPWGGPGTPERCQRLYAEARKKMESITRLILAGALQEVDMGSLPARIVLSFFYKKSIGYFPTLDRKFGVDEKCDFCGICARVCPANNIRMMEDKPQWQHRCHQCFACLHWCPKEALQWGKRTPRFKRYRHPELSLKDLLKR